MGRSAATALVVSASLLLIAAAVAAYARRALLHSDQFANRAAATLHDARVRTAIADQVTDRLVLARQSDLLAAHPIISSAVAGVVGSDAFGSLFRRSVLDVHRAAFAHDPANLATTRRATTCRDIRHRVPNLLAVDFYARGDLFRVADALNGVGGR